MDVDAQRGGRDALADVVDGRGDGLEESVVGLGVLLVHDDDRAHVDLQRADPHSHPTLLHVLGLLRQAEHARVHRVLEVVSTHLQQHRVAVDERA